MTAAIHVEGLCKSFGERRVVDELSMTVQPGEIYGFLGPNGSGKTTSIRLLCGLLTPDAGSGQCLGLDIRSQSADIRRQVGYMTQKFSFWDDLSLRENLDLVARLYELPDRKRLVAATLDQLGLASRARQLAGTLSGGWKQRLALAACLLHQPRLLLLDEPTAGVDPAARRDFWAELHELAATGISVLVSTHYMDEAERCHKLAYMLYGKLLAQGTGADIIAGAGLVTVEISGQTLGAHQHAIAALAGVEQTVPFGATLHASGTPAMLATVQAYCQTHALALKAVDTSLEDVFIRLMQRAGGLQ
ncbi:ABC transporter ATP-binding protein [Chitinibacteraceae bacterium HSL-7]